MTSKNINETIGNTPLIEITHLTGDHQTKIYAKVEFANPGGSIKDRIAVYLIEEALKSGDITPGATIIEATSGNTGIGLAMVCAAKGMDLILTMPESMSIERRRLLEYLGAKIELTDADKGMSGSINRAEELAKHIKNSYVVRQFSNPNTPIAHYRTTAEEIIRQVDKQIDIFVAGVGTGGTIMGVGQRLKEIYPDTKIIAVEPSTSAVLSGKKAGAHGIQGIGAGFIPDILDLNLIDEIVTISDEQALKQARDSAKKAGLLAGISSGANLAATQQVAQRAENQGKTIVTILPDTAERYLSTKLFS